ncbi:MAG: hypothetical protein H6737_21955 [Alphaproteobacteria bacterium]|nr:hypothetical protein [Alphaproteobacteria bacterium]
MIALLTLLSGLSWAQDGAAAADEPDDFAEVVLVWPDKFARWKDTRWLIATEVVIPTGMVFARTDNQGFRTFAWQIKAVIACDQDYKLGGKHIEVLCEIEDVAIQATSYNRFKREKDKQLVQEVLDELDHKLTNAKVQLQVSDRGSVTNVDLEGLPRKNQREGLINETLRQVTARMMYPFHMKLPKSGVKEGNWPEFDSELMSMPSLDGVRGFTTIVHWMNFYKGYLLVQDIGSGVVEVTSLPSRIEGLNEGVDGGGSASKDVGAGTGADAPTLFSGLGLDEEPAIVVTTWKLHMDGVSIYNVDNGIMEERVWSMSGTPTASNESLLKYWYSGRIQLLGADDDIDIGPTQQISYPGLEVEGLPVWLPADPELAKDLEGFRPGARLNMADQDDPRARKKKKGDEEEEE